MNALLGMIAEALPAGAQVVDGFPRFQIADHDLVVVGGKTMPTVVTQQEAVVLGNRRRDETYTIRMSCLSSRGGTNQRDVRDRAFGLMAVVETVVRDDATLRGTVQVAQIGSDIELQQTDADTAELGSYAEIALNVTVKTRT